VEKRLPFSPPIDKYPALKIKTTISLNIQYSIGNSQSFKTVSCIFTQIASIKYRPIND